MSTASETIIDAEWTVVVEVAQPRAIIACDTRQEQERRAADMRLYADDVTRTIAVLPLDRPYRITRQMREVVAAELDAQRESQANIDAVIKATIDKQRIRRYCDEMRAASAMCAPSRVRWTG